MNDIDKIKQLFASQDINNHKLGYILARNTLQMSDEDIIKLIVNNKDGWRFTFLNNHFDYETVLFNTYFEFTMWYDEPNYIQCDGLIDMFVNDINIEYVEEVFWKQLTNNFTNLINEIFDDSTSSI